MRSLISVLVVGVLPVLVLGLIITSIGLGLIQWQPPAIWSTRFGTPLSDNKVTALAVDTTGLYAGGYVGYPINFYVLPSPSNLFLSRYDLNGHQLWTTTLGSPDLSAIQSLASTSDSVFVSGNLNGTGFLRKYDLNGTERWSTGFTAGSASDFSGVSAAPSGVLVVGTGRISSTGVSGALVCEYDSNGTLVWAHVPNNSTYPHPVVYASGKAVYVASTTGDSPVLVKYELNGTLDWTRKIESSSGLTWGWESSGITGDDTGVYVSGEYSVADTTAGFLERYDQNGNQLWSTQIPAPDYSGLGRTYISANPSGIYLSSATGVAHSFLMKYDANGKSQWSFQTPIFGIPLAGESVVYQAGEAGVRSSQADITAFGQSSSLVLFGLNPPFSFMLLAGLVAMIILSIIWQRRRWEKKARPRSKNVRYLPQNQPRNPTMPRKPD